MERYEQLKVVGEGAYGKVIMCRHKETGQVVAIKKFFETDEDVLTRKVALREIRVLRVTYARLHIKTFALSFEKSSYMRTQGQGYADVHHLSLSSAT